MGGGSLLLQGLGRPVGSLGQGSGAQQHAVPRLFPGALSLPAGPRLGELEAPGEKSRIRLLPHSTSCWVKVACFREGPTMVPTSG